MRLLAYIARRLLTAVPVLLGVSFVVFLTVHLLPGDPAMAILGEKANPESLARLRKEYGWDQPFLVQYGRFLERLVTTGSVGRSYRTNLDVREEVLRTFPATIELSLAAMLLATFLGIAAGIVAARFQNRWPDLVSMGLALVGVSVPVFFLGMLLLIAFTPGLPTGGRLPSVVDYDESTHFVLIDVLRVGRAELIPVFLRHLLLPAIALSTVPMAIIARITRTSMIEVLTSDFVRTARAKGLPERRVVLGHAFRNALIPIMTTVGLQFGTLLAGAVLTETVFSWPGIGRFVVEAITGRDYISLQGGVLAIALAFVLVNLVVDVLYALVDPRVRVGGA
ncbi:MAG: ABC transporter permease [Planctomycetota bacterium]